MINNQNNNVNREDILKEIKNILIGYITSNEYNKKIGDLEQLISSNINNMNLKNNSFQDLINKYNNEVKNINQNIEVKHQDFNNKLNNYNNEISILKQNNNKLLTNEIKLRKLNDIIDKTSFLQKDFNYRR